MHSNGDLLERLFTALNSHEHAAMAACYHEEATFEDIAFQLRGRNQVHAMWHMICQTDIETTIESITADDHQGHVRIVDIYTFRDTGRRIRNDIQSHIRFRNGLVIDHRDECDPLVWAQQAFGGLKGELVGRSGLLRRLAARKKLRNFMADHPQYKSKP